jgi:hypothetical protein
MEDTYQHWSGLTNGLHGSPHTVRGACQCQAPEILIANTDAMFAHRVTVHSFCFAADS